MENQTQTNDTTKPIITIAKLTVKTGGDPRKVASMPGGRMWLCDLFGRGLSLQTKTDKRTDNTWTAIQGKFEAFYPETGKTYQSGKLFLPGGIQEVIEAAVMQLPQDDQMASIDFAFRIFAVKATNPIGYTYEAEAFFDMNSNDGLCDIRKSIEARRQLEASKAEMKKLIAPPDQAPAPIPAAPAMQVPGVPEPPIVPAPEQSGIEHQTGPAAPRGQQPVNRRR